MTPALVLMSILWIIGGSYFVSSKYFCPATAAGPATSTLSLMDGDFKATSTGTYSFQKSAAAISITDNAKKDYFNKISTYLKANPDKMLALTGIYGLSENNKTKFNTLGLARAEAVKEVLVKNGAGIDQITTAGMDEPNPGFADKKLANESSVKFEFFNNEVISNTNALGFDESKTVYFEGDEYGFPDDDPKLLEIIEYMESYLITNPEAIVTVSGYTDNQGSKKEKLRIASKRADRIRRIFRRYKGGKVFDSPQVVQKAIGPQDPKADNETAEGMALNNRVTITVE